MKEKVILVLGLPLIAFAADNQQAPLKGSDYISTDVGSTYTYVMTDPKDPTKTVENYQFIVKSCNENKTECLYDNKQFLGVESPVIVAETKYEVKDGAVYMTTIKTLGEDNVLHDTNDKPQIFFPEDIILNKVDKTNSSSEDSSYEGTTVFTKVIPEITVNGNTYNDCIRMDNEGTQTYKEEESKSKDYEVYCKGVGLVTETFSSYNPKTKKYDQKDVTVSLYSISKK
ncbi:hypothetical protein [Francisella hispaniensis]|uniref:hypothetical protein n=1 Tax=Francisella hispaniensis TaxID=622488 RepID=UPI0019042C4B|nr:hypothetical protein [Francisella hispaniensis]MBK2357646.1 hypothetical protein [Francisella hispaniensis]